MKWKKLGQIYKSKPIDKYLYSHASNPVAYHLYNDIYRIFFSGRNKNNKSSVGYIDIDIDSLTVINKCINSVFTFGEENSFYSHGVSIGNFYKLKNKTYIQFMGWQIREHSHWKGEIGRLQINNEVDKLILNPLEVYLGLDEEDDISLSYPFVMFDEGIYKMWYGSTLNWSSENGEMIHVIKYATSKDGNKWEKQGLSVSFEVGVAQLFLNLVF